MERTYIIKCGITPYRVDSLGQNEIFVFGSNLNGYHGGGAAAFAMKYFGAVWGEGIAKNMVICHINNFIQADRNA